MKIITRLSEAEIETALKEYVTDRSRRKVDSLSVELTVTPQYVGRQEHMSGYAVSADVVYEYEDEYEET